MSDDTILAYGIKFRNK